MDKIFMFLRKDNEIDYSKMITKLFDLEMFTDVILGLQAIKYFKPKLLIIDFATSKISGIELIKMIRMNPSNYHTKIIVTAKNFYFQLLENAFSFGADYFIKYPFTIEDIEKVYKYLNNMNYLTNTNSIALNNDFDWATGI